MIFKYYDSVSVFDEKNGVFLFEFDNRGLMLCHYLGKSYDINMNGTLIVEEKCDLMEGII